MFIETKVLLLELLSYEIMAVMEDSSKATGNACCYTKVQQTIVMPQYCVWLWFGQVIRSVNHDKNASAAPCLHSIKAFSICHPPASKEPGGAGKAGRGYSQDSRPQLATGMFHTKPHHAQPMEEEGDVPKSSPGSPKQPLPMAKLSFTENGWIPAFPQEAESEFLILLCLYTQFLLDLMNCLYLTPGVLSGVGLCSDSSIDIAELLAKVSNQGNQRWLMPLNCYHIVHFCSQCQRRAFFDVDDSIPSHLIYTLSAAPISLRNLLCNSLISLS